MFKVSLDNFWISDDLYESVLQYKQFMISNNPDNTIVLKATFEMFLMDYIAKFCPRKEFKID